jgi:HK97 gp10 family phage protein
LFKSNVDKFFAQNEEKVKKGLEDIGKMLVPEIKAATPVITGKLRDSNDYQVDNKELTLYNTAEYASFVELGTIFQVAQPFMRETIYKNVSKISEIMKSNLKV